MQFDLPLEELRGYRPEVAEPADFDAFWERTLDEARASGEVASATPAGTPLTAVEVLDVRLPGFGGDPVAAWLLRPAGAGERRLPTVVQLLGYGGGRGRPHEHLEWAAAGYAHLVVDTRGQGTEWGGGDTADPHGSGPAFPGFMTRGISAPETYYYRRVITDVVRAVDHVLEHPWCDPDRVAVVGASQGGALALAAAALHPGVGAVVADVPFLCHIARAITLTDAEPYSEIVRYLAVHRTAVDDVLRTLSYVDGVNMARRVRVPALLSTGLMDQVCPPSTVFAAANHMPHPPRIEVYPFNGHEGGDAEQWLRAAGWLGELWAAQAECGPGEG